MPSLSQLKSGLLFQADIAATNVGHALAVVGTHYGYDRRVELPDGEMPLDSGPLNTILEPGKDELTAVIDPYLMSKELQDHLPTLREDVQGVKPHSLTIYFYGRLDYETLGTTHKVEFCYYLVRNDPTVGTSLESPIKGDEFVLRGCPKWNSSN
jgi:hypothetical protein